MPATELEESVSADDPTTKRSGGPRIGDPDRFRRNMKLYSRLNVWVYRWSRGRLMNTAMGGFPICVLSVQGRTSGRTRRVPLIHCPLGEDELLVGSQAGLDTDPLWVASVRAHPEVEITAGGRTRAFLARPVSEDETRELWPHLCGIYPAYDDYQARTERSLPVFRCTPR